MKANVTKKFEYNGMFIKSEPIESPIPVEILGVLSPVDPGMLYVKEESGLCREVPTIVLDNFPNVDFGNMLTDEQINERKLCGILFAPAKNGRKLIPLNSCKIKEKQSEKLSVTK